MTKSEGYAGDYPLQYFLTAPNSILKRALALDYLLSRGYLLPDLKKISAGAAKDLFEQAYKYADQISAEIEACEPLDIKFRLPICLN